MKKTRIAILTYHNTRNYGAILQCYALQQTVEEVLNCTCDVLDYDCVFLNSVYKIKKIYENKNIKELIKWLLMNNHEKKLQKGFSDFIKDNINLSKKYDLNTIAKANNEYDIFITGSDQVWNFHLNGCDYTYLLDFADMDKRKIS